MAANRIPLAGALVCLIANFGLLGFAVSIVQVFDIIALFVPLKDKQPAVLPDSFAHVRFATMCAFVFAIGIAVSPQGICFSRRDRTTTRTGRSLIRIAGFGTLLCAIMTLVTAYIEYWFLQLWADGGIFYPEYFADEATLYTSYSLFAGYIMLAIASGCLVLAGFIGYEKQSSQPPTAMTILNFGATTFLAIIFALTFVLIELQALEMAQRVASPDPESVDGVGFFFPLTRVMFSTLAGGLALAMIAGLQIWSANLNAPAAG